LLTQGEATDLHDGCNSDTLKYDTLELNLSY